MELKFGEVAVAHGGSHPELEFAGGAPDDFGAGESEHGEGGGVEFGDGAVGNGEEPDADRAAVEQAAETLFAFAERGGAEFGVAHRLFVQAGVVQHERRHPGKQEAFPDVFGGKGRPRGFAREAEDADTLVATDDGENGRRAEAAGAIDGAAVGIGRVVVYDHRGACGDGPPGQGWFAAAHAVAEEEGSAGRDGADDEGVVFEEWNFRVGRSEQDGGAGDEGVEKFGDGAAPDEFERRLVERGEKLDLPAHGPRGQALFGDIDDHAIPDDAEVGGRPGLGAEAGPTHSAVGRADADVVTKGLEAVLGAQARLGHAGFIGGMDAGDKPRDVDGERRGAFAENAFDPRAEIRDETPAVGGDDGSVEGALGEMVAEQFQFALAVGEGGRSGDGV